MAAVPILARKQTCCLFVTGKRFPLGVHGNGRRCGYGTHVLKKTSTARLVRSYPLRDTIASVAPCTIRQIEPRSFPALKATKVRLSLHFGLGE